METHTSLRKLEEAEYFHNQILGHYNEDNDVCGYYLNAFIMSCRSSLDYVIQDFLYSIGVYDMGTRDFESKKERKNKFSGHPKFNLIEKFISDYHSKKERMRKEDPEVDYFLNKRNMFMHQKEDNIKSSSFLTNLVTSEESGHDRRLEGGLDFEKHPEIFKDLKNSDIVFRTEAYFKELYPNSSEFEYAIRELDMRPFLKSFLKKM